jgi:hypothetical protein
MPELSLKLCYWNRPLMPEIVADLPDPSCYLLLSIGGIQESQPLAPDLVPPRARGAGHRPHRRRHRASSRDSAVAAMLGMTGDHIGRSLRRLEDERFLTGQGRYVDDIAVPGQLQSFVLRSPHGHAVIEGIDAAAARAMPGVHGVFTAADLDADGIGTLPCIARVATVAPMIVPPRRTAGERAVRHVFVGGQQVVRDGKALAFDYAGASAARNGTAPRDRESTSPRLGRAQSRRDHAASLSLGVSLL